MKNKIFAAMVCIIFIVNVKTAFDLSEIKTNLIKIKEDSLFTREEISNIQNRVDDTMNIIYEDNKYIYNVKHSIMNINNNATIKLNWTFKELNKNTNIYLLYCIKMGNEQSSVKWNKGVVKSLGNLDYEAQVIVPFKGNYKFKIIVQQGDLVKSIDLLDIDLLDMLKNRVDIHQQCIQKSFFNGYTSLKFNIDISNQLDVIANYILPSINEEKLKLKNINVKIYNNNKLIKEYFILKDGQIKDKKARNRNSFSCKENINYSGFVKYKSNKDDEGVVEVVAEDYLGMKYTQKGF